LASSGGGGALLELEELVGRGRGLVVVGGSRVAVISFVSAVVGEVGTSFKVYWLRAGPSPCSC
jgi:hypothetical protein